MLQRVHRGIGLLSAHIATFAGHAIVQLVVFVAAIAWLIVGGSEAALASAMTIGGFILTQMVLNQQRHRENALHLKIDELLLAIEGARNEVVGIETEGEERIEELRRESPSP